VPGAENAKERHCNGYAKREEFGPVLCCDPGSVDREPSDSYNPVSVWPTACNVFRGILSLIADVLFPTQHSQSRA